MNEGDAPAETENESPVILVPISEVATRGSLQAKGIWLLAASVIGSFLVVPYSMAVLEQTRLKDQDGLSLVAVMADSVLTGLFLSTMAIAVGIGVARRTGLDGPLLTGFGGETADWGRARRAIVLASVVGFVLALLILGEYRAFGSWLPAAARELHEPPTWMAFLGSIGAGIREEVWLRMGFLSFIVWLCLTTTRRATAGPVIFWTANLLAALMFGALHLPQAHLLLGLTGPVVAFVLIGNGVPGLVWGWLYRRDGLVAAMISHTVADLVMKCIYPLLSG